MALPAGLPGEVGAPQRHIVIYDVTLSLQALLARPCNDDDTEHNREGRPTERRDMSHC
jgi:hypothetical protein